MPDPSSNRLTYIAKLETGTTGLCNEGNGIGVSLASFHINRGRWRPTVRVKIRKGWQPILLPSVHNRKRAATALLTLCAWGHDKGIDMNRNQERATYKHTQTCNNILTYNQYLHKIQTYPDMQVLVSVPRRISCWFWSQFRKEYT